MQRQGPKARWRRLSALSSRSSANVHTFGTARRHGFLIEAIDSPFPVSQQCAVGPICEGLRPQVCRAERMKERERRTANFQLQHSNIELRGARIAGNEVCIASRPVSLRLSSSLSVALPCSPPGMPRAQFPDAPGLSTSYTVIKSVNFRFMPALIYAPSNPKENLDRCDSPQRRPAKRVSNAGSRKSISYLLMRRILGRLRREVTSRRVRQWVDSVPMDLVRLGTRRGGWVLPAKTVQAGGTAVCVGAGEDISFDVELNKLGFQVHTLDPTPRAKRHVEQLLEAALSGVPMAIDRSRSNYYDLRGFDVCRF